MNKYVYIFGIFITVFSMNSPLFAQNNSIETSPELIKGDINELSNLLLRWELESDLLKKAELVKKIQKNIGVKSDGLVGVKTIVALTNLGLSKKFTKPSKKDILNTKILLRVEISLKNKNATKNKNFTKNKNVTNNKNITKNKNVSQKKKYNKK